MNHPAGDLFEKFIHQTRPAVPQPPRTLVDKVMQGLPLEGIRYHRHRVQRRLALVVAAAATAAVLLLTLLPALRQTSGAPGERELVFRLEAPASRSIRLVGDFNNWQGEPMQREGDFWVIRKKLPRGQMFKYAFVVDNEIQNDIRADRFVEDGFGGKTAAVFID